jgi:hypothetical protein
MILDVLIALILFWVLGLVLMVTGGIIGDVAHTRSQAKKVEALHGRPATPPPTPEPLSWRLSALERFALVYFAIMGLGALMVWLGWS